MDRLRRKGKPVNERRLLGVDIGTLGTKAIVVSSEGQILGSAFEEYTVEHPRPSWAEQRPEVWEKATYAAIRGSVAASCTDPSDVACLCISGLYGGSGIPVDREFKPVRPCLIWMDRRATDEVEWIKECVDLEKVFAVTGNHVDTYFGYPKILWIKNKEPKEWSRIHKFIPPSTYMTYKLTGQLAIDYSSAGNLGGLFDIHRLAWSEEMCRSLGIPLEMMPEKVVPSTEVVGEVTRQAARSCGLAPGTPVVAGGVDAPMATLSAGAIARGDNVAMMGTSTCWGVVHRGGTFSKNLVSMPYVVNCSEEIYTWGGSATSGGLVRWFKGQFGGSEVSAAEREGLGAYQLLDRAAADIPAGSDDLIVLPYFMGERAPLWDPHARGMVLGLTLYHTKAHLFRALLEAAAYGLRHSIEAGESVGLQLKAETRVVGGITKSRLWTGILADVTNRQIRIPAGGVGAPLGDALVAGIGVGLIRDYRVIEHWTHMDRVDDPHPEHRATYDRLYRLYRAFYEDTKDRIHQLASEGK